MMDYRPREQEWKLLPRPSTIYPIVLVYIYNCVSSGRTRRGGPVWTMPRGGFHTAAKTCRRVLPTNMLFLGVVAIEWVCGLLHLDFMCTTPTIASANARLQAAVILPHGDFAWDPTLVPNSETQHAAAAAIATAARTVGQWLGSSESKRETASNSSRNSIRERRQRTTSSRMWMDGIDPDVLFLSTPNGISLSKDFAVYLDPTASGSVEIGSDLHIKRLTAHRTR